MPEFIDEITLIEERESRDQSENVCIASAQEAAQRIVLPPNLVHRSICGDVSKLMNGTDSYATLYVMQGGGLCKVGISRDIEKRLKGIRASSPGPIALVAEFDVRIDVTGWAEYVAHVALSPHHAHDEWFNCPHTTAREVCRMSAARANEIPDDWWRSRRHFREFIPTYVHTSKLMRVADAFFYPHLPSKIREKVSA